MSSSLPACARSLGARGTVIRCPLCEVPIIDHMNISKQDVTSTSLLTTSEIYE
ncbi:unnamed protein product [Staurois parvus]|uniref:Uncharacterized protein n=1 Tax=Staurois parvus TaxID=386267 RepID=A0ABN9DLM2_9NEOB|nr:unnamed protein product [Staurois parvus]